ncbi:MAG: S9 family peptidase [Holophagaceae bacterium]
MLPSSARFAGLLAVPAVLLAQAPASAPAASPFTLDHLERLVGLSDAQISPDGRAITVQVSRLDMKANKSASQLVLVDSATGAQKVLVRDRKGLAHARWSPDGRTIAFLADKEGKEQIFLLPLDGGEARVLTTSPTGVQQFAWSPDGTRLAFAAEDEAPKPADDRKGEDGFEVVEDSLFVTEAPVPVHLWITDLEGKAVRKTSGAWSLANTPPPSPPASPLAWSPDGTSIAFAKQASPHTGDQEKTTVQILDVASGLFRPLTGEARLEGFPSYSPDGKAIAYWWPRDGDLMSQNEIHVADAAGGKGRNVTRSLDRCLYRSVWTPDGKALLVGGNDGARVGLWLQPVDGAARRLDLGDVDPSWSFWIDVTLAKTGAMAFTGRTATHPTELYVMDSATSKPRRLTHFNDAIEGLRLGKAERITWKGPQGQLEDGVLTYPADYAPGRAYPLTFVIHGGPQAASGTGFSSLNQLLAGRGFFVFSPNYRGSDNAGNAYLRSIATDMGEGPGQDAMLGLEAVKAKVSVDPGRILVSGWSYGGYMTSWLLGRYPEVWKAGMAGAAVTDTFDQYAFSDGNQSWRFFLSDKDPYDGGAGMKAAWAQSPLSHVHRIKAPTLLLSMTQDYRVPPTQSFKMYRALKERGVPVKMVMWNGGGHFPGGPPQRLRQVMRLWTDWLAEHAGLK